MSVESYILYDAPAFILAVGIAILLVFFLVVELPHKRRMAKLAQTASVRRQASHRSVGSVRSRAPIADPTAPAPVELFDSAGPAGVQLVAGCVMSF
jgi:hypothetical protein